MQREMSDYIFDRNVALPLLIRNPNDYLIVTGLAGPARDIAHLCGTENTNFFIMAGAMGGAVPMGLGLALATGVSEQSAICALAGLEGVRGRMELVARHPNGAAILVDYAHTPDALKKVLETLRPHLAGELHVVFGCGGDRDSGKRVAMGRAAAAVAEHVILTDDNPRTENPVEIRKAVRIGCPDALEIGDRAEAIAAGVHALKPGDILVVAGKGHELVQVLGDTVIPFDDADLVRQVVQDLDA